MIEIFSKKYEIEVLSQFEIELHALYTRFTGFIRAEKSFEAKSLILKKTFLPYHKIKLVRFKKEFDLSDFESLVEAFIDPLLKKQESVIAVLWKLQGFSHHPKEIEREHKAFTRYVRLNLDAFHISLSKIKESIEMLELLASDGDSLDNVQMCSTELNNLVQNIPKALNFIEEILHYEKRYNHLLGEEAFFDVEYIVRDPRYQKDVASLGRKDQELMRSLELKILYVTKKVAKNHALTGPLKNVTSKLMLYLHARPSGDHSYRLVYAYIASKKTLLFLRVLHKDKISNVKLSHTLIKPPESVLREVFSNK